MKTLFRLVVLTLMAGGWALAAASVHVVRTPQSSWPVVFIPRSHMACGIDDLRETYVDTSGWTLAQAAEHPDLVIRIIETANVEYLRHVADPRSRQSLAAQLADAVYRGGGMKGKSAAPIRLARADSAARGGRSGATEMHSGR